MHLKIYLFRVSLVLDERKSYLLRNSPVVRSVEASTVQRHRALRSSPWRQALLLLRTLLEERLRDVPGSTFGDFVWR